MPSLLAEMGRKSNFLGFFLPKCLYIKKKYYLCTAKRKTNCAKPSAQVAELVDAHVSGACAARCAGSSPALGTKRESSTISRLPGISFFIKQQKRKTRNTQIQFIENQNIVLLVFLVFNIKRVVLVVPCCYCCLINVRGCPPHNPSNSWTICCLINVRGRYSKL